jgi:hypothetical protein
VTEPSGPIAVFISYAHRDEPYRRKLETHLSLLKREGVIATWHDRRIVPGDDWADEINAAIGNADLVLFLVSPDFINSDYCWGTEMRRVLEAHATGKIRAIPVIIRTVAWQTSPLSRLQALPKDAKPIAEWRNRDAAWTQVAQGVRAAACALRGSVKQGSLDEPSSALTATTEQALGRGTKDGLASAVPAESQWHTRIGDLSFPWVVAAYGPFRQDAIESHFHPGEPNYPAEVDRTLAELSADISARNARGEDVPFDSKDFKLLRFHVSSRTEGLEEPRLVLHFGPTTFFRMLATDARLDVPLTEGGRTTTLRESYAASVDLRRHAVPELATHWGVGLSIVTQDRYLLLSERGNTAVDPDVFFPSVAEGASRAKDSDATGAPDHFNIAKRGLAEEVGIPLAPTELTWLSFGANSYLCEFALIGRIDTRFTLEEILRRRSVGTPKDKWETKRLHAVEIAPGDIVAFLSSPERRFSPFALIAVVHTLIREFGFAATEAAFAGARVNVSQQLPGWLTA